MEPQPKRLRSEFNGDGRDRERLPFSSAGKPKPCMKFFSTSGCPFGESCHFLHNVPGGLSSLGLAPVVSLSGASALVLLKKAVGHASVAVNGYKTKLCNRLNTPEGCRFGDRCHFAHGESDLRQQSNIPRGNMQPISNGPGYRNDPEFSNLGVYVPPPGNASGFAPQASVQQNQPGDRCHLAHGGSDLRRPSNILQGNMQPITIGSVNMGMAPTGYSDRPEFSNPGGGYVPPPGNASGFFPQAYVPQNQPGDRCHFAHGESDLRRQSNIPRGNMQPITNGFVNTGMAPTGYSDRPEFSNPGGGYVPPPGNASGFAPQAYAQPNQPGRR